MTVAEPPAKPSVKTPARSPRRPGNPALDAVRGVLRGDQIAADLDSLRVYECDGFSIARGSAGCVAFPETTAEVVEVVQAAAKSGVQLIPRGSGTGLTGGGVAYDHGLIISTTRLNRIHQIDLASRVAHVGAGVRNTQLSEAVARQPGGEHYHFAPDPSSQRAATLGGNAATNAGGIHVLKDFVTSSHVLGVELVTPGGELVKLGAANGCYEGVLDLPGLVCGSEGTLGLITGLWVKLSPKPAAFRTIVATFDSTSDCCHAVSDIIAAGHLPAAMEMMDGRMVQLVNTTFNLGIREAAQALLLVEIDGIEPLLDAQAEQIGRLMKKNAAHDIESSGDPVKRQKLWKARKAAFGAIGKISPSYCTQDACVPRSKLAEVLAEIDVIGKRFGLTINNVFHAGDGNVHPIFLYDDKDPEDVKNTLAAAEEVLKMCIDVGGTLTGEHGVGVEKINLMPYLFDGQTMRQFNAVKHAFDPQEQMNAGKLLPSEKVQIDMLRGPGRHVPQ